MLALLLSSSLLFSALPAEKLLFSTTIWRHGERAPNSLKGGNEAASSVFHRGLGQLTDAGIANSLELGRFLRTRYVDQHSLLSRKINEEELHFRSSAVQRCRETLQLVARGLLAREDEPEDFAVTAYVTPLPYDNLLAFTWFTCPALGRIYGEKCAGYPANFTSITKYPAYERLSFGCSRAAEGAAFFTDPQHFALAEQAMLTADSGAALADWMTPAVVQEARAVSAKTLNWQNGQGDRRDERILRFQTGFLADTVLKDLRSAWNCLSSPSSSNCTLFKGYSTHDYIVGSLLELLGARVRSTALGGSLNPEMNAALLIELWEHEGAAKIKVLYRPHAKARSLIDLTGELAGCQGDEDKREYCSLDSFEPAYATLRTSNVTADCVV